MSRAKGVFDQAWLSGADVVRLATRLRQLIEQHLRFFEIRRVEAFGEPAVDRREKVAGFGAPALLAPQPREARRDAQFQRFRPLLLRYPYRLRKTRFALGEASPRHQRHPLEPVDLGLPPALAG